MKTVIISTELYSNCKSNEECKDRNLTNMIIENFQTLLHTLRVFTREKAHLIRSMLQENHTNYLYKTN